MLTTRELFLCCTSPDLRSRLWIFLPLGIFIVVALALDAGCSRSAAASHREAEILWRFFIHLQGCDILAKGVERASPLAKQKSLNSCTMSATNARSIGMTLSACFQYNFPRRRSKFDLLSAVLSFLPRAFSFAPFFPRYSNPSRPYTLQRVTVCRHADHSPGLGACHLHGH